jgi:hypothetical protein
MSQRLHFTSIEALPCALSTQCAIRFPNFVLVANGNSAHLDGMRGVRSARRPKAEPAGELPLVVEVAANDDTFEESDVFMFRPRTSDESAAGHKSPVLSEVTLFVHRWHNVEPGLLSWNFPNLRAALDAVQRMKNAIGWCVVSGTDWADLDAARADGAILVEQLT